MVNRKPMTRDRLIQSLRVRIDQKSKSLRNGCIMWTGAQFKFGYGQISFGKRTGLLVHRVVYALEHGLPIERFDGMVRHTCDNPLCINPEHLLLGSNQDNVNDMMLRDRKPNGEKIHSAKLTRQDIPIIREDNRSLPTIAADYGVVAQTIWAIKHRKIWKHVP